MFGLVRESDVATLTEQLHQEVAQSDFLQERLAELELAIDDIGWQRLSMESEWEFTREGLDRIIALSRLNAIKNPLIRRGVSVKSHYVFAQGVEVQARDADVNTVVQAFLDDPGNQSELFKASARMAKDRALTADGNVVLVLFPNKVNGHVNVRSVNIDEIRDVIVNPDDRQEPWFYLRRWTERRWSLDGAISGMRTVQREAWFPDWRYQPRPADKVESIDRMPVRWDAPIYHVRVGGLDGMRFGVPETYAALDWAKAYKLFLEDWATIVRSLSRFAWSLTVKKNPGAAAARIGSTVTTANPQETNPSPVAGAVFTHTDGVNLQAIPKSGATVASEDGVWLAKMVAAALDIPYTVLMGDPDMGNLATAKTLDRPTELAMMARQTVWAEVFRDLCGFAVDWSVKAMAGDLAGTTERGPDGRDRIVLDDTTVDDGEGGSKTMTGAERRTIDVTFPPILDDDVKQTIDAIVAAAGTDLPNPKLVLRLLLQALGVEDVDEHVEAFDDEYEARQEKEAQRFASAGQVAVDAHRQGLDPAEAVK